MTRKQTKITVLDCLRCSYQWAKRFETVPKTCPRCRSPYWAKPRKHKEQVI